MAKKEKVYLNRQMLSRSSRAAFKNGAEIALENNGYILIEKDGWLIKEYTDGEIEKVEPIMDDVSKDDLIID
ncbi:MAG: hypothetical protein LC664_13375 [Flavobacteriales bacterium]|nr:hypothetical protein [Flavobacteriales bacterium]